MGTETKKLFSKLRLSPYSHNATKVELDGVEIHNVVDIKLRHEAHRPAYLDLTILCGEVDVDLDADIVVDKREIPRRGDSLAKKESSSDD